MVDYMERLRRDAASRGRTRRATCSACATASPARAAGARSGRIARLKGEAPATVSRLARQALGSTAATDAGACAGHAASTTPASASANAAACDVVNSSP